MSAPRMTDFFAWTESLGWQAALCFLFAIAFALCIVILLADAALRQFAAWRERRTTRERNWQLRQQRMQLIIDAQREREERDAAEAAALANRLQIRVWRDRVQANREAKQFHVPAAFRDFKGVQR